MKEKMKIIMAGIACALALLCAMDVTAEAARPSVASAGEWDVLRLTNEKRIENGLDALTTFGALQDACDVRAKEISRRFAHWRPDGTSCFTAIDGIYATSMGENIAGGQIGSVTVVNSWWKSSGHKANMLGESYDHMGVGYYGTNIGYRYYWVQMFVGGCTPEAISVNDGSKIVSYKKGTTIKQMKRYVEVVCAEHGTSYMPLSKEMCKGYNRKKTGVQTVTVNYKGQETTFTVKVTSK